MRATIYRNGYVELTIKGTTGAFRFPRSAWDALEHALLYQTPLWTGTNIHGAEMTLRVADITDVADWSSDALDCLDGAIAETKAADLVQGND